ncbi:MAG: transcription antitermination factor NusB [Actinomycetota bacterium]
MARRREARRRAVGILYQADLLGRDPGEVLEERKALGQKVPGFTEELVRGVAEHQPELDRVIGEAAEEWTVDRMAALDRTLLRVACEELLFRDDASPAVAISEAVAAAKALSTEHSGRFVNGILGRIARDHAATR